MERLSHSRESATRIRAVNCTPSVQPGLKKARARFQVMVGDKVVRECASLVLATETADHADGTVVVDNGGVVRARWELLCIATGGKRVGHWVLVGQQDQRVA